MEVERDCQQQLSLALQPTITNDARVLPGKGNTHHRAPPSPSFLFSLPAAGFDALEPANSGVVQFTPYRRVEH